MAGAVGAGRVALGVGFLLAPTVSVRVLGVDSGTAKRMRFLARMTAARDIGIGVGTLAAGPGGDASPWLLAGALADVTDGVVIAAAMRSGVTRGCVRRGYRGRRCGDRCRQRLGGASACELKLTSTVGYLRQAGREKMRALRIFRGLLGVEVPRAHPSARPDRSGLAGRHHRRSCRPAPARPAPQGRR